MVNKLSSLTGSLEAQYSNGPDSGCLVRVDDNVVAADEGGLVFRLKLNEWSWIEEEEREVAAGGHCTLHQDAVLFTSGHSYNLTSGRWSKVGTFLMSSQLLFRWLVLLQLSHLALWLDSPCSLALLTGHGFDK